MSEKGFGTLILIVVGIIIGAAIWIYPKYDENKVSNNDQTLNAYATFESTCSYRGYDRDECLLIWSGR